MSKVNPKKEREYYEAQQKFLLDQNTKLKEEVEKAEIKKQHEIALNLIQLKSDNDFIIKATGLSIKEIETLRKKLNAPKIN